MYVRVRAHARMHACVYLPLSTKIASLGTSFCSHIREGQPGQLLHSWTTQFPQYSSHIFPLYSNILGCRKSVPSWFLFCNLFKFCLIVCFLDAYKGFSPLSFKFKTFLGVELNFYKLFWEYSNQILPPNLISLRNDKFSFMTV